MLMKASSARSASSTTGGPSDAERQSTPDDLKIGDLARATGKTARALRLYEEMGLLCPGDRSQGGFRMYDGQAIERVRFISELQDMGFTLHDVKALIDATAAREIPREAMEQVRHTFETKLDELNDQLKRLTSLRDDVKAALAYISTCGDCALVESGIVQCVTCDDHVETAVPRLVKGVAGSALDQRDSRSPTATSPTTNSPTTAEKAVTEGALS
jgi:MerR family Zn(II)-responsive transcriptional regulator of zntA